MIYLKRFCFIVVHIISLIIYIFATLLQIATFPVWGSIYYIITGKDPLTDDIINYNQDKYEKFLNWYYSKFSPD